MRLRNFLSRSVDLKFFFVAAQEAITFGAQHVDVYKLAWSNISARCKFSLAFAQHVFINASAPTDDFAYETTEQRKFFTLETFSL